MTELPPPPPAALPAPVAPPAPEVQRSPRGGQLTVPWHVTATVSWAMVLMAYMAVWKASDEIGLATWWLGPRSDPQPVLVRLIPFLLIAVVGLAVSSNVPRGSWVAVVGAIALLVVAVPDFSRSTGLAVVELAIAGAALVISLASLTGTYRNPAVEPGR
ncbi:MAG: hypothetical protein KUG57_06580 [Ilumatobacteraceae bacterium]|nr:hypothetical protein [Ilumatobacteraceae bacterium]